MSVRFGGSAVTTSGFTILRVNEDNPPGDLAVFSGNAHLESASGVALDVHSGESVALSANDANGYNLAQTIESDSWDTWNSDRDQALNAEAAAQTSAPAEVSGGQSNNNPAWGDLDANGSWYNVPDQGYVWSPYDASNPGFDPYGNGNWIWSPGFGYTWASAYSWGYLPYQCGAWNYYGGFGWGWAPGMGGCSPWWGLGYYGGPRIGFAPGWYRPIHRPIGPGGPIRSGRAFPVIAVNRHPQVLTGGLPARNANVPVSINGRTVTALRPRPRHRHMSGPHSASVQPTRSRARPGSPRRRVPATCPPGPRTRVPLLGHPASTSTRLTNISAPTRLRRNIPTCRPSGPTRRPSTTPRLPPTSQRLRPAITPVEAEAEGVVEAAVEAMQAAAEVAAAIARVPPIQYRRSLRYRRPRPQFSTADLPVVCSAGLPARTPVSTPKPFPNGQALPPHLRFASGMRQCGRAIEERP